MNNIKVTDGLGHKIATIFLISGLLVTSKVATAISPVEAECPNSSFLPANSFDLIQTAYLFKTTVSDTGGLTGISRKQADFAYAALTNGNINQPYLFFDNKGLQHSAVASGLIKTLGSRLIGGDWKPVWGPGVYEFPISMFEADNTAFVVYSASQDTYILAIAGTNATAGLDWLVEDFQVGPEFLVKWPMPVDHKPVTVPLNQIVKTDPMISKGTADGVFYLLNRLVPSQYAPNKDLSLQEFLSQLKQSEAGSTKLIVTGHSLGGALAPTLANWAQDMLSASNPGWAGHVFALPTAVPTPGNAAYASLWDSKFPQCSVPVNAGNSVKYLNTLVYSKWDVVPHAWNYLYKELAVPEENYYFWMYDPLNGLNVDTQLGMLDIPWDKDSKAFVAAIAYAYTAGKLADMTMQHTTFEINENTVEKPFVAWPIEAVISGEIVQIPLPTSPITDLKTFLEDIAIIHGNGYRAAFGIPFEVTQEIAPIITPTN